MAFKAKKATSTYIFKYRLLESLHKTGCHENTGILKNICYTKHVLLVQDLKMI